MNGLDVGRDGGVVSLTLDRPERRNALTTALLADLRDALHAIADDDTARAVVVAGSGRSFCAGADLDEIAPGAPPEVGLRRVDLVAQVVTLLGDLRLPTIGAVHGAAIGAGWGLALACDLCLAAPDATFALPEVPKGFRLPPVIVRRLVEVAGPVRAADLVLSGRAIDADEAVAAGIVARVVAAGDLRETACGIATALASGRRERVLAATTALRRRGMTEGEG